MLSGKLIGSLSDIHRLKQILSPEAEELFGNTEGSADVMDGNRLTLTKLL